MNKCSLKYLSPRLEETYAEYRNTNTAKSFKCLIPIVIGANLVVFIINMFRLQV